MKANPTLHIAQRLQGIAEYYFSQKLRDIEQLRQAGRDILPLGIGSPDIPPHPSVVEALRTAVEHANAHSYQPYRGLPVLRTAIAAWYQWRYGVVLNPEAEVLPLMGSKEGIAHVCLALLNGGDRVLVPNPGYPTYRSAVHIAGGECVEYALSEERQWYPDMAELERLATEQGKRKITMMWVNYPHMPTGQGATSALFEQLIAFGRKHNIIVCHDNPYSCVLNDNPASMLQTEGAKHCVLELNSLSKSHNMAGWRVGMLVGAQHYVDAVLRCKSNMDSGMFFPVQQAAVAALSLGQEWYNQLNAIYAERRAIVHDIVSGLGCSVYEQDKGMFVWAKVPVHYANGNAFADYLLQQHDVFVVPGAVFGSEGVRYIRASLCCPVSQLRAARQRLVPTNTAGAV